MAQRFQSLSFKVIATFILLTALAVSAISVLGYFASSRISDAQALKAKESVLIFRGDMLQDQLAQLENQANSIARIEALQMSITSLKSGWKTIEKSSGDVRGELKRVFITNNPNPADQREKLMKPEGPSGFYYSNHEKTQGEVARDLENTAFSDLLIADVDGSVLYSYKKDDNFAENLKADAWKVDGRGYRFRQGDRKRGEGNGRFRADRVFRPARRCFQRQVGDLLCRADHQARPAEGHHPLQGTRRYHHQHPGKGHRFRQHGSGGHHFQRRFCRRPQCRRPSR